MSAALQVLGRALTHSLRRATLARMSKPYTPPPIGSRLAPLAGDPDIRPDWLTRPREDGRSIGDVIRADVDPAYAREMRRAASATSSTAHEPVREAAQRILRANLHMLESIVGDDTAKPSERTAALAQIARIADAYSDTGAVSASERPLSSLSEAELVARVAACDELIARVRVELEARTPGGGGE